MAAFCRSGIDGKLPKCASEVRIPASWKAAPSPCFAISFSETSEISTLAVGLTPRAVPARRHCSALTLDLVAPLRGAQSSLYAPELALVSWPKLKPGFCRSTRHPSVERLPIHWAVASGVGARNRTVPVESHCLRQRKSPGRGRGSKSGVRSSYIFFEHLLVLASHMPPAFSQSA